MLKLNHKTLILISGAVWMAIGCFLLFLGLNLLVAGAHLQGFNPLLSSLAPYLGGMESVALLLVVVALYIGYMKGRFVLSKAAQKGIVRIRSMPEPANLSQIYSPQYYLLIGAMVLLGMSIKWFGFPNDIRGTVDVAIGAALINGAVFYFRQAYA